MKKTTLIIASVCLLMASGALAEQKTIQNDVAVITTTKSIAVSSFCKAIMQGDIEMVKRLIDLGEDVNRKSLGMTPAIFAARYNKAEILKLLIKNGANLKIKSDKGYSIKKHAELSNAIDVMAVLEAFK
ncbi:MAG: ankyrin repeat domain-containing protein [Flavobacteriaceae bacterium]